MCGRVLKHEFVHAARTCPHMHVPAEVKRGFSKDPSCMNVIHQAPYSDMTLKIDVVQLLKLNCQDLGSDSPNWM